MAGLEPGAYCIPDFGPVVSREHILKAARLGAPALTLVCAPPGYGKSVLAAQLIAGSNAEACLWIPLYDTDVRGDEWWLRIAEALSPTCHESSVTSDPRLQFDPDPARGEAVLRIRRGLRSRCGRDFRVVLDGANRIEDLSPFFELADLLRGNAAPNSRVIVTCRSVSGDLAAPDPAVVWVVDMEDLRFDGEEIQDLLRLGGHDGNATEVAGRLLERFSGHPALTALMVRHSRIDDAVNPPQDLVWHTRRLVGFLEPTTLAMAFGAALLREGSTGELESCFRAANLGDVDWSALQALSPLLRVVAGEDGATARFGMHAVLCDALFDQASARLEVEICARLRSVVLARLTQSLDFVRVVRTLHSACAAEEIASWCEVNGMALLHRYGAPTLERCLERLPPMLVSSSARLLLLRSASLREQEHIDEALAHVGLAVRIAESDGDPGTQASALLFAVRLAIDISDLRSARQALSQLDATLRSHLSEPEDCLLDAYTAAVEVHCGDSEVADSRALQAARALGRVDKSAPEAAWSASCLASVMGPLHGRWDEASALLASVDDWPGTTLLQALQCRANGAFANLELGSLGRAESALRSVLDDADAAGLHIMGAYALGTLAAAIWFSDKLASRAMWDRARKMHASRGDYVGSSAESTSRAMLCRAEGSAEEALAHAEAALAQLREHHDALRLLRISAETEVAASMLALGDRWGASRIASRIESELEGSVAAAHILTVSMVLAEIDRLNQDAQAAAARLASFSEYIATGSANHRVAVYACAFPGLLGVAVRAFGADNLPLRMVRLIPEAVIESAFALGDGLISEADRQVLLARAWRSEHPVPVVDEVAAKPPCRVRLFGGFEVVVNGSRVEDAYWRKRKVRLLFAMLAAQRGQDMPRDVILERLWPGMDEERARRNFYVTWSAMKRALSSVRSAEPTGKYAVCTSGVCRVTSAVSSDLDDFQAALAAIRAANSAARSEAVLVAARHLLETYRGDVLPGDLYEEWFADLREQTKHDFCDAMLLGAQTAEALGDSAEALVFLRRAGGVDPWREDIYQAMMRAQIEAGQRSRAIETYMTCRGRLVDDLGIDPSAETTRLYQAVLAMESDPVEEVDRV